MTGIHPAATRFSRRDTESIFSWGARSRQGSYDLPDCLGQQGPTLIRVLCEKGRCWGSSGYLRNEDYVSCQPKIPSGKRPWNPTLRKERDAWGTLRSASGESGWPIRDARGGRVAHPFSSVHLRNEGYFSCQRKSQEEAPVESHSSTNEGRATRPVFTGRRSCCKSHPPDRCTL